MNLWVREYWKRFIRSLGDPGTKSVVKRILTRVLIGFLRANVTEDDSPERRRNMKDGR